MKSLLAAIVIVGFCASAHAQDKPVGTFGWLAVGKAHMLEPGHIFWVGEFSGTLTSDKGTENKFNGTGWKCPGINDIDVNKNISKAAGICIVSDAGGKDQAFLTWQCEGEATVCRGRFTFTGGTGRYQGISGDNTFTGHTVVAWKDDTLSGYSDINR